MKNRCLLRFVPNIRGWLGCFLQRLDTLLNFGASRGVGWVGLAKSDK